MHPTFHPGQRDESSHGGLWLLMVEDQRFDAMLLRKQLAAPAIGCGRVDHAETLAGAIDALGQFAYDAILLDLGLSDSDGVDAVRVLRAKFPDVAIIVLTGRDEEALGIAALASGAQDMLVKGSFEADVLARSLHYAIERHRLQIGLGQSAEEHRTLFENNPFPVWVHDALTLRFLAVNAAAIRDYGYTREEFLRMTVLDLHPSEDATRVIAAIEAGRSAQPTVEEWRHRRSGGVLFDVEINAQAIDFRGRPARIVLARDITMRKRAVRALEVSEGRFRKLFQYSLGLICTHDLDGVMLSVNPAAARALDFSVGDLMGRRLPDMMPPERRFLFVSYMERIMATGTDSGLLPVVARDGSVRIWEYHNILDSDADEPYVLGHAQDITERRQLEQRLREQSTIDPLTGCRNRRFLEDHKREIGDATWGCIVIDLDHFKQINDTLGHARGDEVLVGMADFLRAHAPAHTTVVRFGGDEFLLVVDDAETVGIPDLATAIRADDASAPIGFTFGTATRIGGESFDTTLRRADQALYETRAAARGTGGSQP